MTAGVARRRAEIAGAGLGGLTLATALAQRGWGVRLHERAAQLRDLGVGTTIWQNGQRALEAVGALAEVAEKGTRIGQQRIFDAQLRLLRLDQFNDTDNRAMVVLRVDHHRALVNAALKAGVQIVTSSAAVAAEPEGVLIMENGERLAADLVIGCDGFGSKIRDSLKLADLVGFVTNAHIGRVTVPRDVRPETERIDNYWAGPRRFGVLGCGAVNYIFLSAPEECPHNAQEVASRSLYKPAWIADFPFFEELIQRVDSEVVWSRYSIVRCKAWSAGRAAILGDSAHAMPPTMAQGAGCAMMNAVTLAEAVTEADEIPAALAGWERRERPITDVTQRWAVLSIFMTKAWPHNLLDMRSEIIQEAFTHSSLEAHFHCASRHEPEFSAHFRQAAVPVVAS